LNAAAGDDEKATFSKERLENMQEIKIGWASRDISTTAPVDIPGQFHMRISEGIQDPITITTLVLDNGVDLVIFLTADLVAMRACLVKAVRAKVAALDPSIPVEKIIMNVTHTHEGASYYEANSASMASADQVPHDGVTIASSDDYREELSDKIASAIVEAYNKRAPGGIAYGYSYAVVGHSRRVVYFDDLSKRPGASSTGGTIVAGHAAMYGNTNDPNFSHYEAGADHFVNLLYTFDLSGKLTGAIVNVPCPSQCSEHIRRLSGDYWHDFRVRLRKQHGSVYVLPQCAAAGDLSPRILHAKAAQERRFRLKYGEGGRKDMDERKDIAERLLAAFNEALSWASKDIQTHLPLGHIVKTIELERRLISEAEAANEQKQLAELEAEPFKTDGDPIERLNYNSRLVSRRNRCRRILHRYELQKTQPKFAMELHAVRVGDVAFANNSFELYMDYMHRIQARSPFVQTFIIQLAGNEESGGYLATERGVWGKGYSASIYCNVVSPAGGQQLVEETLAALQQLHDA